MLTLGMTGLDNNAYATAPLAFNISTANLVTAVTGLLEAAGFHLAVPAITGGVGNSGGTNPYAFTFGGTAAGYPIPLMTVTSSLTGGGATASCVLTTQGVTTGMFTAYNGTKVAAPTTAGPTVTDSSTAGSFVAVNTYGVSYTYTNVNGETTPSQVTLHTMGTGKTSFTAAPAETALPAGATGINYYVDGILCAQANAVTALQVSGFGSIPAYHAPNTSTAFVATDGSQIPVGPVRNSLRTDAMGNLTLGNVPNIFPYDPSQFTAPIFVHGFFFINDLVNLDANAVAQMGRIVSGSLASGQGVIHIS